MGNTILNVGEKREKSGKKKTLSKVGIAIPSLAYCVPTNILEHGSHGLN